jgi:hypothetical protein
MHFLSNIFCLPDAATDSMVPVGTALPMVPPTLPLHGDVTPKTDWMSNRADLY